MTDPSRVRISGSLQPFAADFATELARQGYTPRSVVTQLHLMAHVSRWLHAKDLDIADLPGRTQHFLQARQGAGYKHHLTGRALRPLLTHLRDRGAIPPAPTPVPAGPVDETLAHYRHYLTVERAWAKPAPVATSMRSTHFCGAASRPTASRWTSTNSARLTRPRSW